MAGLPVFSGSAKANVPASEPGTALLSDSNPVSLRPLNFNSDNLFAGHRSHSSHASHASHYSGSSGGYVAPNTPAAPVYQAPQQFAPAPPVNFPEANNLTPNPSLKTPATSTQPATSTENMNTMLMRQVMRVQIALTSLKFYDGRINGVLDQETKSALRNFQILKGLPDNGLMTTPTLNALGVPAVN